MLRTALAAFAALLCAAPAVAADGWTDAGFARLRLIEASGRAALQVDLKDGWKTYWKAPGPMGLPPKFDWSTSENLAEARPLWPRPQKLESAGEPFWGYDDDVAIGFEIIPKDPKKPVVLKANVFLGVCEKLCAPVEGDLSATPDAPGAEAVIREAEALAPRPAKDQGLKLDGLKIEKDKTEIVARIAAPADWAKPDVLFAAEDGAVFGMAETTRDGGVIVARATMDIYDEAAFREKGGSITLFDGARGAEMKMKPEF